MLLVIDVGNTNTVLGLYDGDKLIHDYFGIDYDIVWDIVVNEIPELRTNIKKILKESS